MGTKFGAYLRGARLGYGYVAELDAFVRVSGDGPFYVEVAREAKDMHPGSGLHRVWWWNDKNGETLLAVCPYLRTAAVPSRAWLDDDAQPCEEPKIR